MEEGSLGNLSPKAGSQWPAGDDKCSTRGSAVDGVSVEMASSTVSFPPGSSRAVGGGENTRRAVSFHIDLDFWVLDLAWIARRPIRSSRKTSPNPTMHVLSEKEGRPAPGSPSTGRRTAVCFGTCTAGFSLHRARNTKSKKIPGTRKGLATIQDSIRAADMSKSGTITEPGIGHAKQSTRAQEWPKMTSTWTPDSSFGFPKPRHLENINSSNPNALNPDASAGQHNLH